MEISFPKTELFFFFYWKPNVLLSIFFLEKKIYSQIYITLLYSIFSDSSIDLILNLISFVVCRINVDNKMPKIQSFSNVVAIPHS